MFESIRRMTNDLWSNTDVENQTPSNSSRIWDYTQILLKGVGILAVGGVAYTFFRNLTTTSAGSHSTTEENALTTSNEKSAVDIISMQTNFNIQSDLQTSYQTSQDELDIVYRGKRDAVSVANEFLVTNESIAAGNIIDLLDGTFMATWINSINYYGGQVACNIYVQHFSDNGTQLGDEVLVTQSASESQGWTGVFARSSNGDVVLAWLQVGGENVEGIYAQNFASNGTMLGDMFQVMPGSISESICNNSDIYCYSVTGPSSIGALSNEGEFVFTAAISMSINGGTGYSLYAQRFASNGTMLGDRIQVLPLAYNSPDTSIVSLTNEKFAVVASVSLLDSYNGLYIGCYTNNGTQFSNQTLLSGVYNFATASVADSGFVILFSNSSNAYGQSFDNNCMTLGGEFPVKSNVDSISAATSFPSGQLVMVYLENDSMYVQSLAINGTPLGNETLVTIDYPYSGYASIINLANDYFMIAWGNTLSNIGSYSNINIYAQVFTVGYGSPILGIPTLSIYQGETVVLGAGNIQASSGGRTNFNNLLLLASNVEHGQFARINQTDLPISNFTQGELINSLIQFTQDNSYFPPAYKIAVSDGFNLTAPQAVIVSFKNNPHFIYNNFTIADGKGITLTANALLAVDYQNSEISFTVKNISHGTFATGGFNYTFSTRTTNFNQIQINASQILFFHDGSNVAPSYFIQASDGNLVSNYQAGNINFLYSSPSVSSSQTIGAAVGGVAGAALLAGLGIFGGYRYKKAKAYAEERARYPLANALYDALKIKGVDDFTSNKGLSFVNAVDALNNELVSAGISIQQMVPEELSELAERLAKAIKAQVSYKAGWGGIELNSLDIQDKAKQIVQTAQTLQTLGSSAKSDNKVIELTKF